VENVFIIEKGEIQTYELEKLVKREVDEINRNIV
jgi:hypothetical protein